jgi:TRAP-type mannitol/chloroaromatic compound transport system permease large subunit
MAEWIPFVMFLTVCLVLMAGYPVAFSLAGTALIFAFFGMLTGHFDPAFLQALPNRLYGIMQNGTLIAVPLFVLMGIMLEKSRLAEDLLSSMADLFGRFRSGLGVSVVLVGALLAASTGIVGATVVTMGLMSLPTMLKRGYSSSQATGIIAATGTLGQIIPPSIALVLLGDTLSSAYQQAQLNMGIFTPKTVSIGDLFVGAIVPGLILVLFYISYVIVFVRPESHAQVTEESAAPQLNIATLLANLLPPVGLIIAVLGSILAGAATPSEAAGVGAFGALLLGGAKRPTKHGKVARGNTGNRRSYLNGFFDTYWRCCFLIGISRLWWRRNCRTVFCQFAWRPFHSNPIGDASYFLTRIYSRFYRNNLCRCAYCGPCIIGDGLRSSMAWGDDRD